MITIKESTNTFDTGVQSSDSILTGDMRDSKIIFQSDQLGSLSKLTFKVELYFGGKLIFETMTPVLYEDGIYGISNIDLSGPIRDYLITQNGLSKYGSSAQINYLNFRNINTSGQVKLYEYEDGAEYAVYTFDTYIYKTTEKNLSVTLYNNGVWNSEQSKLLLNKYFVSTYSPETNVCDFTNKEFNNEVYRNSEFLFYLFENKPYQGNILNGTNSDGTFSYSVNNTVPYLNTNIMLTVRDDSIKVYPTTNLEWEVIIDGTPTSGTDFTVFDVYFETYSVDTFTISQMNHSYKYKYKSSCEKYPHQLRWVNMLGGYDTFNFDLIHQETLQVSDKGYYQNNYGMTDVLSPNDFKSSYLSYDKKFNKKYIFKTDWLTDDQIYLLEDLFKSPEVYFLSADHSYGNTPEWVAMKNLTKTQTLYHKDKKGLKRYEIAVEESIKKEII